ncbi:uncharacterized protein E5676_scaffold607G00080 [Cucumis melo var. makuwa]|uniref:Uncharacterized protein n=1 Tax=Cucumis melo var. makuwa TaxID=1194695 RepID=A0A5D3D4H4_CUCMM|nr:uncharacterized protein E6C27_scaffold121G00830 [Cucumis melo var. makuwa]TYK18449.1 uncharacterized protein E5676_scaffold607G00080 [Cucumis melo var. makuwa]
MSLVKSSMIVDEYEKKFNEFTKYVQALVIDVVDTCKHFEDGLRIEVMSPMMTTSYWLDFSKLVKAGLRVERHTLSMEMEKGQVELRVKGQKGQGNKE